MSISYARQIVRKFYGGSDRKWSRSYIAYTAICGLLAVWVAVDATNARNIIAGVTNYFVRNYDWLIFAYSNLTLIVALLLALSPYGRIKLGGQEARPRFNRLTWFAMLFAAAQGAGLIFWGLFEPITHFYDIPIEMGSNTDAPRYSMLFTVYHWGLHPWSLYALLTVAIGYFATRADSSYRFSESALGGFKNKLSTATTDKAILLIEFIIIFATLFGGAAAMGIGSRQLITGAGFILNADFDSVGLTLMVLAVLTITYTVSACTGLQRGIKIISDANLILAFIFLVLFLVYGPTQYLFGLLKDSIIGYTPFIVHYTNKILEFNEPLRSWTHNWTILFILAFISWVPFVAIFIARISIGRTIREVILGVMFMPAIALCLWFSALGGNGIYIDAFGVGGMQEHLAKDFTLGIFYLIEVLFDSDLLGAAMIFLIFVFLVTSGEAIVYSLAMLSEHGEAKPSSRNIIYWSVIMFIITSLVINSDNIFVILALSGVGAVPLILVFILSVFGLFRQIYLDTRTIDPD